MENVFQVVGYQNSGKTTLMEKLLKYAAERGLRPASIKHHGHGGVPDAKDSTRHQQAGAFIAGVEGEGILQLNIQQEKWPLSDIIKLYSLFPVDCIFVEGFKKEPYPKAVLIRTRADLPLIELENIQCVISWIELPEIHYPLFHIKNDEEYISFIMALLHDNMAF